MPVKPKPVTIAIDEAARVSGLLFAPPDASACYVMAHGAGAGMNHPFMAAVASGLAERGIATLRYQFLYMERGSKRPDPPKLAHAAVRGKLHNRCRTSAGWRSSDSLCIRRSSRRASAASTSP